MARRRGAEAEKTFGNHVSTAQRTDKPSTVSISPSIVYSRWANLFDQPQSKLAPQHGIATSPMGTTSVQRRQP